MWVLRRVFDLPLILNMLQSKPQNTCFEVFFICSDALNLASKQAGYNNFQHTLNPLLQKSHQLQVNTQHPQHLVKLSTYWYDSNRKLRGRETLFIALAFPLSAFLSKVNWDLTLVLRNFSTDGRDHNHFHNQSVTYNNQNKAREYVCDTARTHFGQV
jgi:hypothetical protein